MSASEFDKVYTFVGRIALSWNQVDLHWYLILTCLMKETPRQQIDAIFHLFQTGASQRQFVMAVAGTLKDDDPTRQRVGQLHSKTCNASGNRNAAIHALLMAYPNIALKKFEPRVQPGSHPTKKNKLAGKQVSAELANTLTEIIGLVGELSAFLETLAPKFHINPDIVAALLGQGVRLPSWAAPSPLAPLDDSE